MRSFCLLILLFGSFVAHTQMLTTEWVMYPWQIDHLENMEVVNNNSESLVLAGEGIEISVLPFNGAEDRFDNLREYGDYLKKLFNLEDPDPVYPFPSKHINSLCIGGYMELSRVIVLAIEYENGKFFATAIFDDDDLDAEKMAIEMLKTLRPVQ